MVDLDNHHCVSCLSSYTLYSDINFFIPSSLERHASLVKLPKAEVSIQQRQSLDLLQDLTSSRLAPPWLTLGLQAFGASPL